MPRYIPDILPAQTQAARPLGDLRQHPGFKLLKLQKILEREAERTIFEELLTRSLEEKQREREKIEQDRQHFRTWQQKGL